MRCFRVFILLFVLVACGEDEKKFRSGFTNVSFHHHFTNAGKVVTSAIASDVMVYIRERDISDPDVRTIVLGTSTPSITMSLPNNNYDFYAFGSSHAGFDSSGTLKCGHTGQILDGNATTVSIELTSGICTTNTAEFNLKRVYVHGCFNLPSSYTTNCGTAPSPEFESYKMEILKYNYIDGEYSIIGSTTTCIDAGTIGGAAADFFKVPAGDAVGTSPVYYRVTAYDANSCSGTAAAVYYFTNGFAYTSGISSVDGCAAAFGSGPEFRLYLRRAAC